MNLKYIELTNFKSFKGKHRFDFSDKAPGLYLISGGNELEPKLGRNGAGKSTLIDGIVWCMYGKTMRKLKASDVSNWEVRKKTVVKIGFDDGKNEYELSRGWSPNHLKLTTNEIHTVTTDQKGVEDLLGINFDEFCHSIVIGQFNEVFFDLSPTNKLQLFTDVLRLEKWLTYSERAKGKSRIASKAIDSIEADISRRKGKLEATKESIAENEDLSKKYDADRANKLLSIEEEIDELKERSDKLSKISQEKSSKADAALQQYESMKDEGADLEKELSFQEGELRDVLHDMQTAEAQYDMVLKDIKRINSLGAHCDVCLQKISDDHKSGQKKERMKQKKDLLSVMSELRTEINDLESHADGLREEYERHKTKKDNSYKNWRRYHQDSAEAQRDLDRVLALLGAKEQHLSEERDRENPYDSQVKALNTQKKRLVTEIKNLKKDLKDSRAELAGYEYWVKGFKEIRLFLVEEALTFLEVEVNNALLALGLDGWKIKFDVEKENKSGGLSKGFHVFIYPPNEATGIPWEAWSGGETQRLRLSGALGLSNLITNHTGVSWNIFVLDEPTTHMGTEGITDLLDYLVEFGKYEQKQVWLVDHHALDYGDFSGVFNVIKDEDGSHITEGRAPVKLDAS